MRRDAAPGFASVQPSLPNDGLLPAFVPNFGSGTSRSNAGGRVLWRGMIPYEWFERHCACGAALRLCVANPTLYRAHWEATHQGGVHWPVDAPTAQRARERRKRRALTASRLRLSDREEAVLLALYAPGNGRMGHPTEVAHELGLAPERVRRIAEHALTRLAEIRLRHSAGLMLTAVERDSLARSGPFLHAVDARAAALEAGHASGDDGSRR
jgi:hypothetical protein